MQGVPPEVGAARAARRELTRTSCGAPERAAHFINWLSRWASNCSCFCASLGTHSDCGCARESCATASHSSAIWCSCPAALPLEMLKNQGVRFRTGEIEEWLDCGNKDAILYSNERMLEFHRDRGLVSPLAVIENSVIVPPCFIGDNAVLKHAVVGPYVSVGHNSTVENTVIANSIIQNRSQIKNAVLENSMVGNSSRFVGSRDELNLGDYSHFTQR